MSRERMKAAAEICRQSCCRLSAVTTPKGSGARKSVWRSARNTARTSSMEASTPGTPPRARTTMSRESRAPNCRRQAWIGIDDGGVAGSGPGCAPAWPGGRSRGRARRPTRTLWPIGSCCGNSSSFTSQPMTATACGARVLAVDEVAAGLEVEVHERAVVGGRPLHADVGQAPRSGTSPPRSSPPGPRSAPALRSSPATRS